MARPPAQKDGDKLRAFSVNPGFIIGGEGGKRFVSGDTIQLNSAQAKYYQKLAAVSVDVGDYFNDETSTDTAEAGARSEADGGGEPPVGAASDEQSDEGAGAPRRKR